MKAQSNKVSGGRKRNHRRMRGWVQETSNQRRNLPNCGIVCSGSSKKAFNRTKSNLDTITQSNQKSKTIDKQETLCRKDVMQSCNTKDFVLKNLRHLHSKYSNLSAVKIICLFIHLFVVGIICAKNGWKIEYQVLLTSQQKILLLHYFKSQNGIHSYKLDKVQRNICFIL